VLLHFMELASFVHEVAERPELGRALEQQEREATLRVRAVRDVCDAALRKYNDPVAAGQGRDGEPFRFWSAYNAAGFAVAHTKVDQPFMGEDFSGRDYFVGAKRLGQKGLHQTHLSFVFVGTSTREFEFAISAPIFGSDGRWLGALVASVLTTGELNSAPLDDQRYSAVLVGPEDPTSGPLVPPILLSSSAEPVRFRVFRHRKLERGTSPIFEHPQVRAMALSQDPDDRVLRWQQPLTTAGRGRALERYRDPFGEQHPRAAGQRLAAFAPIGRTGYTFIVQSNDDDALGREKRFLWRLLGAGAFAAALGTLLGALPAVYQFARLKRRTRWRSKSNRAKRAQRAISTA
jgi:hypothetical protein